MAVRAARIEGMADAALEDIAYALESRSGWLTFAFKCMYSGHRVLLFHIPRCLANRAQLFHKGTQIWRALGECECLPEYAVNSSLVITGFAVRKDVRQTLSLQLWMCDRGGGNIENGKGDRGKVRSRRVGAQ